MYSVKDNKCKTGIFRNLLKKKRLQQLQENRKISFYLQITAL